MDGWTGWTVGQGPLGGAGRGAAPGKNILLFSRSADIQHQYPPNATLVFRAWEGAGGRGPRGGDGISAQTAPRRRPLVFPDAR